ncbi:MAG: hypothetical protein JST22_07225 [Bacteroidetes bacterium]|nr:hypothetical protein [Bacteroidota bacterium]
MTAVQQGNLERAARSRALFTIQARRLLAEGKPAHAAELCRRGLVHFPYDHLGYILLAQAYLMLGRRDRAVLVLGDGYRRTGSPRLDLLRTELDGPAISDTQEQDAREQRVPNALVTPTGPMETVEEPHAQAPHPEVHHGADTPAAVNTGESATEHAATVADAGSMLESVAAPEVDIAEIVLGLTRQPAAGPAPTEQASTEATTAKVEEHGIAEAPAGNDILNLLESVAAPEEDIAAAVLGMAHQTPGAAQPSIEEVPAAPPAATAYEADAAEAPATGELEATLESVAAPEEDIANVVLGMAHQPAIQPPAIREAAPPAAPEKPTDREKPTHPEAQTSGYSLPVEQLPAEPPSAGSQSTEHSPAVPSPAASVKDESVSVPTMQVLHPVERSAESSPGGAPANVSAAGHIEPPVGAPPSGAPPSGAPPVAESTPAPSGTGGADAPPVRKPEHDAARPRLQSLALHTVKNASRLRSSNLRLIPGLEFAPLRHEDPARRQLIAPLINEPMPQPEISRRARRTLDGGEMPPLPPLEETHNPFEAPLPTEQRIAPATNLNDGGSHGEEGLTPLEELARRLEHARIPAVEEPEQQAAFQPSMMSETLADILVRQGAFTEALKAYQTLARANPERLAHYQQRIAEMQQRIREAHEGDAGT